MSPKSLTFCNNAAVALPTGIPFPVPWPKKPVRAFYFVRVLQPPSLLSKPRRTPMPRPDLQLLSRWLEPTLVNELENRRRLKREWHRRRKLTTLETLWLMLAVSLDTQRSSLYEILRLTTGQLAIPWSVSVAAFCKARAHFSPGGLILVIRRAGLAATKSLSGAQPLERLATAGQRQNHTGPTRIPFPLEMFRRPSRSAGFGFYRRRVVLPL